MQKYESLQIAGSYGKILPIIGGCLVTFFSDWSQAAVMCPFLYEHRNNFRKKTQDIVLWTFVYALVYFLFLDRVYSALQMFTFLSIPVLAGYHGERGRMRGMGRFFCICYPAYLLIAGIIRTAPDGDMLIIFT